MKRSAPALVLALAGIALCALTWGTWGDVQVDYGGEVYAAWRVSQGAALYRDVAYFTGPLSPWLNALWFKLFGVGIWTLYAVNLALVALDTALVYALVKRMADRFSATAAGLVFLALFAFGRFEFLNDSNYIAPYSHEVVHATPLALGCLLLIARFPALAGALFGLVCLTKAEYTLALGAAALVWLVLARADWKTWARFASAALVAPVLAWAALASALGARAACLGVIGAWRYVFDTRITQLHFYKWVMGTDEAGDNLVRLLEYAAAEALLVGACWLTARRLPRTERTVAWIAGAALGPLLLLLVPLDKFGWLELARPWPLFAGVAALVFVVRAWKQRELALTASFAVFSAALLAKMVLNSRVQMYGFALALPATLLLVLLLSQTLPRLAERRGGSFTLARALGCGALLAFALGHLRVMFEYQKIPTVWMGEGRDAFRVDGRGGVVAAALNELHAKLKPGESFVVLPEGVMLNYLARVPAPVKYINYMPPELLMFGEQQMVADLSAAAPAAIVLLHKSTGEYGFPWFGRDYGKLFAQWINADYSKGALFGDEPLRDGSRFGARVLWRKDLGAR
ncbi:MAG: glycosyltransferase family 39 protein [Planctomycetes bacterium]|nr:glycosyltransferase family 39 protein [Planctomycetota bacterium]